MKVVLKKGKEPIEMTIPADTEVEIKDCFNNVTIVSESGNMNVSLRDGGFEFIFGNEVWCANSEYGVKRIGTLVARELTKEDLTK